MSVDFRAGLVYGYKISYKDHDEMIEKSNWAYEDDFICVNAYHFESDYIFGMWIKTLPDGFCAPLDMWEVAESIPEGYAAYLANALEEMDRADLANQAPLTYIIHQVS